jgi:hypothetical protein
MSHLGLTPIEYIKQRFRHGEDRETAELLSLTYEEEKRRQEYGEVCAAHPRGGGCGQGVWRGVCTIRGMLRAGVWRGGCTGGAAGIGAS